MKYIKTFESFHLADSVTQYANICIDKLNEFFESNGSFPKRLKIKIDNPADDFKIKFIILLQEEKNARFHSDSSDKDIIVISYLNNYDDEIDESYYNLLHELTHAYQFHKLLNKNISFGDFTNTFQTFATRFCKNKYLLRVLFYVYLSSKYEIDAYITAYHTINKTDLLDEYINEMKNFDVNFYFNKLSKINKTIEYDDNTYILMKDFPQFYYAVYNDYMNQYEPTRKKTKEILKFKNKTLLEFLIWFKNKLNKTADIMIRKRARIISHYS